MCYGQACREEESIAVDVALSPYDARLGENTCGAMG